MEDEGKRGKEVALKSKLAGDVRKKTNKCIHLGNLIKYNKPSASTFCFL